MSGLPQNEALYDRRIVERNIKSGLISKEDYQKFLAEMPDLHNVSEKLDVPLPGDDAEQEQGEDE